MTCPVCNGEGAWHVDLCHLPAEELPGGLVVTSRSLYTELCSCRKALEPRDGEARWWTKGETVAVADGEALIGSWSVTYDVEVPVSADNYVVKREGYNAYWPTLIELELGGESRSMLASMARELAAALIAAADAVEALDAAAFAGRGEVAP